ncbi:MAG: hypothetical protein IPM98_17890 [Lewinellaceae bacterium]|nr:hypothetical protein [Lewinellaceae bacterium]
MALQADLFVEQGRAQLLRARGGFDPKLYGDFDSKNFNDKNYFQYTEAGVKWPTWFGLELKGTTTRASGVFLNPRSKIPDAGQVAAGFSWTRPGSAAGRPSLPTSSRGVLVCSKPKPSAVPRSMISCLLPPETLLGLGGCTRKFLRCFEEALRQAEIRYAGILESFVQGDKPAIDTLEGVYCQVQN